MICYLYRQIKQINDTEQEILRNANAIYNGYISRNVRHYVLDTELETLGNDSCSIPEEAEKVDTSVCA